MDRAKIITGSTAEYVYPADEVDAELAAIRTALETAESENRFLSGVIAGMENTDNERIQAAERERDDAKLNTVKIQYAIALQCAIEYHCNGKQVPDDIAAECPHHAKLLNAALKGAG